MSPSFVFSSSLSMMLCLACYSAATMGMLFAIGLRTFSIFAFAGLVFIATELCVYLFRTSSCDIEHPEVTIKPEPFIVSWQIQLCVMILFAMSFVTAVFVLYANTSGGDWSARMSVYKELLLHNPDKIRYRFIVAQLFKININIIGLFGYVMVYNLTLCNVPVKTVLSYMIDTVLYALFSAVYMGVRQAAIEVLLSQLMVYVALNMKPGGKQKIYRFILKVMPVLILMASLFTVTGNLVGRVKNEKSSLENLAIYICGGLYYFNRHIDDPHTKQFGQASFAYVYAIPQNMGIIPRDDENMVTGEFDIYGNTATIFGRWYKDFGTPGVLVMTCIVSLIYSLVFYYRLLYTNNIHREHHLARIYYCQFMTGLIWAGYDDRIASLFTIQNVSFLIFVRFLFWLLIDKKFKLI